MAILPFVNEEARIDVYNQLTTAIKDEANADPRRILTELLAQLGTLTRRTSPNRN